MYTSRLDHMWCRAVRAVAVICRSAMGGSQNDDVERAMPNLSSRIAKFAKFIHEKFENI